MLMIAGVNLAMAQGLSSNDIKASWDFKNGTVAYSIVSADIPAGSTFAWNVDSKSVTDGISDSGQTITLPLTNALKLPGGGAISLGVANQVAQARTDGYSYGAAGAVSNSGGVSVGGNDAAYPADATVDLSAGAVTSACSPCSVLG